MASREHRYYGWVVVGVVFVALLVSAGVRAAPTVLVNPLETTLGRSRATISIKLRLYGLSGPVSGGAHGRDNGSARAVETGFRESGGGSKLALASRQERLKLFVEGPGSLVVWQ
jgi:hypothetical protein